MSDLYAQAAGKEYNAKKSGGFMNKHRAGRQNTVGNFLAAAIVLALMVGEAVAAPGGNPFESIKEKLDRIEDKIDWLVQTRQSAHRGAYATKTSQTRTYEVGAYFSLI